MGCLSSSQEVGSSAAWEHLGCRVSPGQEEEGVGAEGRPVVGSQSLRRVRGASLRKGGPVGVSKPKESEEGVSPRKGSLVGVPKQSEKGRLLERVARWGCQSSSRMRKGCLPERVAW